MKKLILLLTMFALVGCAAPTAPKNADYFYLPNGPYEIRDAKFYHDYICIDGIEYLQIYSDDGYEGYYGVTTHFDKDNNVITCDY